MIERNIDSTLAKLHKNSEERHPKIITVGLRVISSQLERRFNEQSLNSIGRKLLLKFHSELEVGGVFHSDHTLIVANHPSWFLDFLAFSAAYTGDEEKLKVIARDEIAITMPDCIKKHFVPVSGKTRLGLYQPKPVNISIRDNIAALYLTADHILKGGNALIFPQGTTDEKFARFDVKDRTWKPGAGIICQRILKKIASPNEAFVQPVTIDIEGDKRNPFSQKQRNINLLIGAPVSIGDIATYIENKQQSVNPSSLTEFIQRLHQNNH